MQHIEAQPDKLADGVRQVDELLRGDIWQLKIVSDVVGTGHITAQLASNAGLPPNQAITDPAQGQGSDAEINVKVLPGHRYPTRRRPQRRAPPPRQRPRRRAPPRRQHPQRRAPPEPAVTGHWVTARRPPDS